MSLPGLCAETRPADGPVNQHAVPGPLHKHSPVNTTSGLGVAVAPTVRGQNGNGTVPCLVEFSACCFFSLEEVEMFTDTSLFFLFFFFFPVPETVRRALDQRRIGNCNQLPGCRLPQTGPAAGQRGTCGAQTGFGGVHSEPACSSGCRESCLADPPDVLALSCYTPRLYFFSPLD